MEDISRAGDALLRRWRYPVVAEMRFVCKNQVQSTNKLHTHTLINQTLASVLSLVSALPSSSALQPISFMVDPPY